MNTDKNHAAHLNSATYSGTGCFHRDLRWATSHRDGRGARMDAICGLAPKEEDEADTEGPVSAEKQANTPASGPALGKSPDQTAASVKDLNISAPSSSQDASGGSSPSDAPIPSPRSVVRTSSGRSYVEMIRQLSQVSAVQSDPSVSSPEGCEGPTKTAASPFSGYQSGAHSMSMPAAHEDVGAAEARVSIHDLPSHASSPRIRRSLSRGNSFSEHRGHQGDVDPEYRPTPPVDDPAFIQKQERWYRQRQNMLSPGEAHGIPGQQVYLAPSHFLGFATPATAGMLARDHAYSRTQVAKRNGAGGRHRNTQYLAKYGLQQHALFVPTSEKHKIPKSPTRPGVGGSPSKLPSRRR
ncbi:hypothetical protein CYMTET_47822 [Cymbomonas tetramitiformis]|uniref:Uncharacterized protein n=1 Tax=Cymbomonas tetramitiformis TaxID=36881 RepID=A0AAE0BUI8_9CHLO|nr:hypothetical protein CYMTET_47822 [Cymbomonas tetramitiformis]